MSAAFLSKSSAIVPLKGHSCNNFSATSGFLEKIAIRLELMSN